MAPRPVPTRLLVVATALGVVVAGATALLLVFGGSLFRDRITLEARKRGVELVFSDASFWWWSASLHGVRFRLEGVPGLEGTALDVDVSLRSWEPRRITATTATIEVTGSAADLAVALGRWTERHPHAYDVPVSAHGVGVRWSPAAGAAPWLVVDGGSLAEAPTGVIFTADRATVSGVQLGGVAAAWTHEQASVTLGFGSDKAAEAPVRLVVRHGANPPTATATLAPTDLGKLTGPLGVPLPVSGVTASGSAELAFPRGLESGPVQGRIEARLDGWVPPHPPELDGFLFGGTTTFTTDLVVPADRTTVTLTRSRVKAGAFELQGGGAIERREDHARVRMTLSGNLPCAAVAESAAAAHVGSFLAALVGGAAQRVVEGSVAVRVTIDADSRDLAGARVGSSVGVGCGLTPLRALDPKLLREIPRQMEELLKALPPSAKFESPVRTDPGVTFPGVPSGLPFFSPSPPASARRP